jgi:hypothetical protein
MGDNYFSEFLESIGAEPSATGTSGFDFSGAVKGLGNILKGTSDYGVAGQIAGLGGMGYLLNKLLGGGGGGYAGYQGGIPALTASRQMLPIPQTVTNAQGQTVPRRPGSGGITYFSPMTYAPVPPAATGGGGGGGGGSTLTDQGLDPNSPGDSGGMAKGGITTGRFLRGGGDGVSDSIPAQFAETGKPARLADGEFVLDARTVSEIGNGSSEAGARKLYAFMKAVHGARKKAGRGSKSGADKHLKKLLA